MNQDIGHIIRIFEETVTVNKGGIPIIDPATGRLQQPVDVADTFEMKAAIYPAKDRELLFLPEGTQLSGTIVVWSERQLTQSDMRLNKIGDEIIYKNESYEVQLTQDWGNTGNFFKHIAIRKAP